MMLDELPRFVTCKGRRYRLRADYRRVLLMMDILRDNRLTNAARTTLALSCVFWRLPASRADRDDLLMSARRALFPAPKTTKDRRLTDIDQDADLIRSAFRQAYGIDLRRARLHWVEFAELWANLPEGTRYSEVVGIRAMPVPEASKYNAKHRQSVIDAKAAFSLQAEGEAERMARYTQSVRSVAAGLIAFAKSKR